MTEPLRVAVLGCGSVGSQVVRLLGEQAADLAARVGAPVELVGVAVRRIDAPREVAVPAGLLTTDAAGLVEAGKVTELAGGDVTIGGTAEAPTVTSGNGTMANILCGHIPTSNATVFVIDKVLMPAG